MYLLYSWVRSLAGGVYEVSVEKAARNASASKDVSP